MSAQHSSFHLPNFNFISEVILIVITIIIENMDSFLLHRAIPSLTDSVVCPFWEFVAPQVCIFFFFFDMDHFSSLYWIFQVLLLFYVLVFWPWGVWYLNSLTRDQTHTLCIRRQSLNRWTTRKVPDDVSWLDIYNSLHLKHGCPVSILLFIECKTSVIWLLWDIKLWTAFRDETVTF